MRLVLIFILVFTSVATTLGAQVSAGRIVGVVVDSKTGAPLSDVTVQVTATEARSRTSVDGRFSLVTQPGTVAIQLRRIGFAPKTVSGIVIPWGGAVEQNVTLDVAAARLAAQVVTASAERGTVSEALNKQRATTAIVNSITAEQIARSPDGDAAQAVGRVSGVTVQDNKYVFVRGLGERYTTTSLNGVRIPSPEPERRAVPLDIFPSSLLQSVTTSKTFTPDQPGDFSGAQVNLETREFPLRRVVTYATSVGFNAAATGKPLPLAPAAGSEWLGFGGSARTLPAIVAANGNFGSASQQTINQAIRSFRDVWTPTTAAGTPNYSTSLSAGGQAPFAGLNVGYLASGSYGYAQGVQTGETRALAVPDGKGGTRAFNSFAGTTATRGVLWGGLLNLSTLLGTRTRVVANNTFNRSADNAAVEEFGVRDDFGLPTRRTSLDFVERSIRSNQLRIERELGDRQRLALSVSSSGVSRGEPDRTEVQYVRETDPATNQQYPYALFSYNPDGARKTFAELHENSFNTALDYQLRFIKAGVALRSTDRSANNQSYSIIGQNLPRSARELSPEELFQSAFVQADAHAFTLLQNSTGGSYSAADRLASSYAMAEITPWTRLRLTVGARVEYDNLVVRSFATTGDQNTARLNNTDVLPAIVTTVALSDNQNLRLSATQTLSRPEYRELSPISYRDVIAQRDVFGNANLVRTLIQNYDARWEWYPRGGEVISFGAFGKRFSKPIEQVDVATSGASQLSFINADAATDFGGEVELRLQLDRIAGVLAPVTVFTNGTVIRSNIDISSDKLSALTNKQRAMVGQAPYVFNGGVTYASASGRASGTLLFNTVGKRIIAAGVTPLPDSYEQPRSALDLSLQVPLFSAVAARVDAKNLLNSPHEERQGSVIREQYYTGRVFTIGLRWQPQ